MSPPVVVFFVSVLIVFINHKKPCRGHKKSSLVEDCLKYFSTIRGWFSFGLDGLVSLGLNLKIGNFGFSLDGLRGFFSGFGRIQELVTAL